jgi:hypothetical protein
MTLLLYGYCCMQVLFTLIHFKTCYLGPKYILQCIQWVPGALSLGVKQPGREADDSPPSSVEVSE